MGIMQLKFYRTKTWDILPENQISPKHRFIEIIKVFKIYAIIAYTKLIHAPYRIFLLDDKSWSCQMRLLSNKKGKSML
jgi:hypothetical protein